MYSFHYRTQRITPQSSSRSGPPIPPPHILLTQNQNSIFVENKIQQRIIVPKYNIIDLPSNNLVNNIDNRKTIIHVLDYSSGFGDYLRGSILLAQYAKYFNLNFKMNLSKHYMNNYVTRTSDDNDNDNDNDVIPNTAKINLIQFNGKDETSQMLYALIQSFIRSNQETIYITTNLYYNTNLVSDDIRNYINSVFTFKQEYYDKAARLFNLKKYNVLHIRCKDDCFTTDFNDFYLLSEIIKLQLGENTIVMSNNYVLKRKINKLFGFHFIDTYAYHTANMTNSAELESTVIEYIILTQSARTYCYSYYHYGSGFSEQCSVLHNIHYSLVYLPNKNMNPDNAHLLINHYDELFHDRFILSRNTNKSNPAAEEGIVQTANDDIAFITLTNNGYIDYTLNCLQSLDRISMKQPLHVYCIGDKGYSVLQAKNVSCDLIQTNDNITEIQEFRRKKWSNITYYKFEIIYKNLLNHKFVCITDGDIVYENNQMFDYLLQNIDDNDLLIQSECISDNDLCSGFMFIQSNETTRSIFHPDNVEKYRNVEGWDDQIYVNSMKYNLKYKKLPLKLFPSGNYFYTYSDIIDHPFLIHFNWVIGNEKKTRMAKYNKWFNK